jgi:hypothetical protein
MQKARTTLWLQLLRVYVLAMLSQRETIYLRMDNRLTLPQSSLSVRLDGHRTSERNVRNRGLTVMRDRRPGRDEGLNYLVDIRELQVSSLW